MEDRREGETQVEGAVPIREDRKPWRESEKKGKGGEEEGNGELPEEEKVKNLIPFVGPPFATHTQLPHTAKERGQSPPEDWVLIRVSWVGSEELIENIETLPLPIRKGTLINNE